MMILFLVGATTRPWLLIVLLLLDSADGVGDVVDDDALMLIFFTAAIVLECNGDVETGVRPLLRLLAIFKGELMKRVFSNEALPFLELLLLLRIDGDCTFLGGDNDDVIVVGTFVTVVGFMVDLSGDSCCDNGDRHCLGC